MKLHVAAQLAHERLDVLGKGEEQMRAARVVVADMQHCSRAIVCSQVLR